MATELCKANASERGLPIVILAQRDKVAMEEELAKHLPSPKRLGSVSSAGMHIELSDGLGCYGAALGLQRQHLSAGMVATPAATFRHLASCASQMYEGLNAGAQLVTRGCMQ